ncbi:MAG: dolichol-phosphate mannosyltransferase, partial [Verrucomicrobiota bacterium]
MNERVSIIVPTRNEAENVEPLVRQIFANLMPHEVLFVDGDSTDGTQDVVERLRASHPVRVLAQDRHLPGLAAAIMAGARAAEGELLVVMDADLSHPPERINDLLGPLIANEADMVVGSRYIKGGSTSGWPPWRKILSRTGAAIAYPVTGVHDAMCGFFAIRRARLLEISPPTVGFKIAFETITRARSTMRVREIPIQFRDRTRGQSKMSFGIALRFFVRWLAAIVRRAFVVVLVALPAAICAKDVEFRYVKPDAQSVALMCECKNWEAQPMTKSSDGVWTTTVSLSPGSYGYKFFVNVSDWAFDPDNSNRKTVNGVENSSIDVVDDSAVGSTTARSTSSASPSASGAATATSSKLSPQ